VALAPDRLNPVGTRVVLKLTPALDAVLTILDWLPEDTVADAALISDLLGVHEAAAARLLHELEEAGRHRPERPSTRSSGNVDSEGAE
jgi:hypothetical protein